MPHVSCRVYGEIRVACWLQRSSYARKALHTPGFKLESTRPCRLQLHVGVEHHVGRHGGSVSCRGGAVHARGLPSRAASSENRKSPQVRVIEMSLITASRAILCSFSHTSSELVSTPLFLLPLVFLSPGSAPTIKRYKRLT